MLLFSGTDDNTPNFYSKVALWLDGADISSMTLAYVNLSSTVSGTSGQSTLTCSGDESLKVFSGVKIKVNASEEYTVSTVSTTLGVTTITTSTPLTASYTAKAIATKKCSQWNDKSSYGNHATQASASYQWVYRSGVQAGKSTLQAMNSTYMELPSGTYGLPNGANTMFAVVNCTDESEDKYILGMTQGGGAAQQLLWSSSNIGIYGYYNGGSIVGTESLTKSDFNILVSKVSGGNFSLQANNGYLDSNTNAAQATSTRALLGSYGGGGNFFIGNFAEIVWYNVALSTSEVLTETRRLSRKWKKVIA